MILSEGLPLLQIATDILDEDHLIIKVQMSISLLFILVVAINSIAVYMQRKYKTYTKWFGGYDLFVHTLLLAIIWGIFLLGLVYTKPPVWTLPSWLHFIGVLVGLAGLLMVIISWVKLGTRGTLNGWFFAHGPNKELKDGLFRLRNPMYTGFVLLFVSIAFWHKNAFYLWLAVLSFILLNVIQARIESPLKDR